MYRLHIDFPLSSNLEKAKILSEHIVDIIERELFGDAKTEGVDKAQYRLSHDNDRGNKNYLVLDDNGHCTNKKITIE